jgi:Repeat of unknown function (DUF5648)
MSLYFDSVASTAETITGSAGNDLFRLNIAGIGWNYINTGAGNDTVIGLGRAPADITDGSGADVYQYILRETPFSRTTNQLEAFDIVARSSATFNNFGSDDVIQIPSATFPGQPRLFTSYTSAMSNLAPYGISGSRDSTSVGFYIDTSGDRFPDYIIAFPPTFGSARYGTSYTTIDGVSFIEFRLRTGVVTDTPNMVYRFFNMQTGSQFLTASETEREVVLNGMQNMSFEGTGFRVAEAPGAGLVPVYRFNNLATGGHPRLPEREHWLLG